MRSLRSSLEKTEEKLKETERQLAAAQAENHSLKHQVLASTHKPLLYNAIIIEQTLHGMNILIPWTLPLFLLVKHYVEHLG